MKVYYNDIEIGTFRYGLITIAKEHILDWKPQVTSLPSLDIIEDHQSINLEDLSEEDRIISLPNTKYLSIETSFDSETDTYVTICKIKDRLS